MVPIPTRDILSKHDQEVLDSILNPLELTSRVDAAIRIDNQTTLTDVEDDTAIISASKALEAQAIKAAELGNLEEALKIFAAALEVTPSRPSLFNNRAQSLRLVGRDVEALSDLNQAVALAGNHLRTRCHALCQRGVLMRKMGHVESARSDFEEASQLGSSFARAQLVEINPFAALCNQMLRQAFQHLQPI